MKIEPFLISSTVNLIIAQRLVRTTCPHCKKEHKISDIEYKSLIESLRVKTLNSHRQFYKGTGCAECDNTGYRGRIGIFELLEIDDKIREAIMKRENASVIENIAIQNGMTPMLEDGFRKAIEGKTTIEEILRVIYE
jgi:type II secretory ATPase GspE/PulE/Tfp pilus assembly ATPase PilB-like protein